LHYWLGLLLERKGDLHGAAAQLDTTIMLNPSHQQAKTDLQRVNSRLRLPARP
jgi:hypothetical protein